MTLTAYVATCTKCFTVHLWYGERPKHCILDGTPLEQHGVVITEAELNLLKARAELAGLGR